MTDGSRLAKLLNWLGYAGRPEWVDQSTATRVTGCRSVLRQAFENMSVMGSFGIIRRSPRRSASDFIPFVYVASADDETEAMVLHRSVWSQGLVPFLLIISTDGIWHCDATTFTSREWRSTVSLVKWEDLHGDDGRIGSPAAVLYHLKATRIRTSIRFSDSARAKEGSRADEHLLGGLRALGERLTGEDIHEGGLATSTANKLIAGVFYLQCLIGRGYIPEKALEDYGFAHLLVPDEPWNCDDVWDLFLRLDLVFNGRVFLLPREQRETVTAAHLNLVRGIICRGERLTKGGLQFGLFDIDLSFVRTETLSAVYEMFFENQGGDARDEDGAFYTPPYLVDHVLAKVDEIRSIQADTPVLDCAAGSGMFLVGAFRKIVERILDTENAATLPLPRLRDLLARSIYGIERNEDAIQVAAFSLFLTMLEYAGGADALGAELLSEREPGDRVFPDVIGSTLLRRDLFDKDALPHTFPQRFPIVLGNPPWQKIQRLGALAEARLGEDSLQDRVDLGRAAELFFWTAYERFLDEGGAFGMILSAKSFLSPGANRFPREFIRRVGVEGMINLTHLRRKLFQDAEHPAIAVVGRRTPPSTHDGVWVHYPLLSSLPLDKSGRPWCIVQDAGDVELHRRANLADPNELFRALMLRPIDRRAATYLDDRCRSEDLTTIGELCWNSGLSVRRGAIPKQVNLPKNLVLGTKKSNDYVRILTLDGAGDMLVPIETPYQLPPEMIMVLPAPFRHLFAGGIVAVPRSFKRVDFIPRPFAFNSSINGIYADPDRSQPSQAHADMLRALALYLRSSVARYLAALYGHMWIIDRRRFEASDLERLPVPLKKLDDPNVHKILQTPPAELDGLFADLLGLHGGLKDAYDEYVARRRGFENGRLPITAMAAPSPEDVDAYLKALESELAAVFTKTWNITGSVVADADGHQTVVIGFTRKHQSPRREIVQVRRDDAATSIPFPVLASSSDPGHEYTGTGSNEVATRADQDGQDERQPAGPALILDEARVVYEADRRIVTLSKPHIAARWFQEQAVVDGRMIVSRILASRTGRAA